MRVSAVLPKSHDLADVRPLAGAVWMTLSGVSWSIGTLLRVPPLAGPGLTGATVTPTPRYNAGSWNLRAKTAPAITQQRGGGGGGLGLAFRASVQTDYCPEKVAKIVAHGKPRQGKRRG